MLPLLAAAAVGFSPLPPSQTTVRISSEEELTGAVLGPLPELGESLPASLQAVCAGVVPCAGQADDPTAWRPPRGGAAQPCKGQGDDPTIALVSLVFSILFNPSLFQVVPRGGTESVASRGNSPAPTFLCSNSTAKNSEWVAENAGPTAEPPIKVTSAPTAAYQIVESDKRGTVAAICHVESLAGDYFCHLPEAASLFDALNEHDEKMLVLCHEIPAGTGSLARGDNGNSFLGAVRRTPSLAFPFMGFDNMRSGRQLGELQHYILECHALRVDSVVWLELEQ